MTPWRPPRQHTRGVGTRLLAACTAAAGAVMLLGPHAVARLASGTGSIPDAAVVRILGGRQLLQGTALLIRPAPPLLTAGLGVDALHAASMVAAAVIWPGYRRAALTSAAVAGGSAVAGALIMRGNTTRSPRDDHGFRTGSRPNNPRISPEPV
jgi:hypothetical protein